MTALNAPENVSRRDSVSESRLAPNARKRSRIAATVRPVAARRTEKGVESGILEIRRTPLVPLLVVTDTVKVAALPLEIWSVDGPRMLATTGAPLYASEMVPL